MKSFFIIVITAILSYFVFQQMLEPIEPVKPGEDDSGVVYIDSVGVDNPVVDSDTVGAQCIVPQPCSVPQPAPKQPIKQNRGHKNIYDLYFQKYSDRFFGPAFDWQWFKAQGIAESNLNPDAKSYCHAQGIMQILPSTHADIIRRNPWIENNIWSPRWNIAAGICYDRQMWNYWTGKIDDETEQIKFMFGSYNGGYGNVLKAYVIVTKYGLTPTWQFIIQAGKRDVSTWRVGETERYVGRIFKVKNQL